MTGWLIFLGIVLFFVFIFSLKANVRLEFGEELTVVLRILCFNITLAPAKEKKPVDIKGYSFKKHQKRLRGNYEKYQKKQEKKAAKKQKKTAAKEAKKEKKKREKGMPKKPKRSILDWVDIAGAVIGALFSKFSKRLRIKVARLKIKVATGDAATTAIMYGAVIQSVAYIIEILDRITNLDGVDKADISVEADYLSESMTMDLCFVFSIRVWHLFDILFGTLGKAIKKFFETTPDKKNTNDEPKQQNKKPSKNAPKRSNNTEKEKIKI